MNAPLSSFDRDSRGLGFAERAIQTYNDQEALFNEIETKERVKIEKTQADIERIEDNRLAIEPPTYWETKAKQATYASLLAGCAGAITQLVKLGAGASLKTVLSTSGIVPALTLASGAMELTGGWDYLETFLVERAQLDGKVTHTALMAIRIGLSLGLGGLNLYHTGPQLKTLPWDIKAITGTEDTMNAFKAGAQGIVAFFTTAAGLASAKGNWDMAQYKATDLERQRELEKLNERLSGSVKKLASMQKKLSRRHRDVSGLVRG